MIIKPKKLRRGDRIGVVSPSTPVVEDLEEQFIHGVRFLEGLGFQVVPGKHVRSRSWGYAASPEEKAEDINRMFADESIAAIICSQGGATANACLPYLDWEGIRRQPKIFLGISDITVLLNAIQRMTGLITFHGNDLMWGFGRTPTEYDRGEFVRGLMEGESGPIPASGERKTIRGGKARGRLLGGNLHCLMKLAGTRYFPDFREAILFVEALGIRPEECDHLFQQLKQMGVFDQIRGALIGHINGLQNDPKALMQMEDVLLRVTEGTTFPILKVDDFGHNCPNTVLPVGGRLKMDADEKVVEIVGSYVE